jgi:hypothetical protein
MRRLPAGKAAEWVEGRLVVARAAVAAGVVAVAAADEGWTQARRTSGTH